MASYPDGTLEKAAKIKTLPNINLGHIGLFRGQPYVHQNIGVAFMYAMGRCICADGVGLGKTIEALMLTSMVMHRHPEDGTVVIIVPGRSVNQWKEETFRFLGIKPTVLRDLPKSRRLHALSIQPKLVLAHYELIVRYPMLLDRLRDISLVVLDEAAAIKSHSAKTSVAVKMITARAKRVVPMTATPVEVALADIHSIAETLHLDFLPRWTDFKKAFVRTKRFSGVKAGRYYDFESIVGYQNLPQALALFAPIVIRRTEDDINVKLPPIVPRYETFEFDGPHLAHYQQARKSAAEKLGGAPLQHALQVICDGVRIGAKFYSPKIDYVVELLKGDLHGKKAIVYATHLETLKQIYSIFRQSDISCVILDGSVSMDRRSVIQKSFNDSDLQVIIADDVIKNSLNLPACKHFFILDVPPNPAKLLQLVGRARRIDATLDTIFVHILTMDGSHEEDILKVSDFRSALASYIVGNYNQDLFPDVEPAKLLQILRGKS